LPGSALPAPRTDLASEESEIADTAQKRVLITTPTGMVGSAAARRLIEGGKRISVFARDEERLPDDIRAAAELHLGSLDDAEQLRAASRGAAALLLVFPIPPDSDDLLGLWLRIAANAVAAVEANGIEHVVILSTEGAGSVAETLMGASGQYEQTLRDAVPNVRALRAGFFMENLLPLTPVIAAGELPLPIPADRPQQLTATRDVAAVAARYLSDLSWTGHAAPSVYGPQDLTPVELAEILTRVTGWPVRHVEISVDEFRDALIADGLTPHVADANAAMMRQIAEPGFVADPRLPETAGATTFEQFATEMILPGARAAAAATAGGRHETR